LPVLPNAYAILKSDDFKNIIFKNAIFKIALIEIVLPNGPSVVVAGFHLGILCISTERGLVSIKIQCI
jgi:hypothetical protein